MKVTNMQMEQLNAKIFGGGGGGGVRVHWRAIKYNGGSTKFTFYFYVTIAS
jgi:hypothetical protein